MCVWGGGCEAAWARCDRVTVWAGRAGQLFFAATAACSTYLVRFDTLAAELRSTCHSSKIHDIVFPVRDPLPPPPPRRPTTQVGKYTPPPAYACWLGHAEATRQRR